MRSAPALLATFLSKRGKREHHHEPAAEQLEEVAAGDVNVERVFRFGEQLVTLDFD